MRKAVELNVELRLGACVFQIAVQCDFLESCLSQNPYRHSHPKFEIHYVTGADCTFVVEGRKQVCQRGELLIVPPHLEHVAATPAGTDGAGTVSFVFTIEAPESGPAGPVGDAFLGLARERVVRDQFGGLTRIHSIQRELQLRERAYYEKISGEFSALLADLARALSAATGCDTTPTHLGEENRAEQIEEYIAAHYREPGCSCRNLAELLHIGERQLHRICVQSYGKPFRQLLLQARMEIAEHLLKTTAMRVRQVAEYLGYDSVSAFSVTYKKYFGTPPGKCRREDILE